MKEYTFLIAGVLISICILIVGILRYKMAKKYSEGLGGEE